MHIPPKEYNEVIFSPIINLLWIILLDILLDIFILLWKTEMIQYWGKESVRSIWEPYICSVERYWKEHMWTVQEAGKQREIWSSL